MEPMKRDIYILQRDRATLPMTTENIFPSCGAGGGVNEPPSPTALYCTHFTNLRNLQIAYAQFANLDNRLELEVRVRVA